MINNRIFRVFVMQKNPPEDKNVVWFDSEERLLKIYQNGKWEVYNEKELNRAIETFDVSKVNATDDESIIMLSGCKIPKEPIELINEALKETIEREKRFDNDNDDDLFIKRDNIEPKETIKESYPDNEKSQKKKSKSRVSKAEFKKLLKDL